MKDLDFSYNWNKKLDCTFFTTLRLSNRFEPLDWVLVTLKQSVKGRAVILDKKALKIENLNGWVCGLDTGYSTPETIDVLKKMYPGKITPTTTIYLYLLRYENKQEKEARELKESMAQTALLL